MLDVLLYYPVSAVMWAWHQLFASFLGAGSGAAWALSVAFLVLTLRAVLIKPFIAQMRSARVVRSMAPQLTELRERYRDDPEKLLTRSRALQKANGVSTAGTLLPALAQMPVFLGLFQVLNNFRPGGTNYAFGGAEVSSFLEARLFGAPLSAYVSMPQPLLDSFAVARLDVVLVAVPLLLVAAVATFFSMRGSLRQQEESGTPGLVVLRWLPWLAPLGLLVGGIAFPVPLAILVYWLTSNVWTLGQQHLVHRRLAATPLPEPAPSRATAPKPGAKPVGRGSAGRSTARRRHA